MIYEATKAYSVTVSIDAIRSDRFLFICNETIMNI